MSELNPDQIREMRGRLLDGIDRLNDLLHEKGDELSADQIKEINRATRQMNNAIVELTAKAIVGTAQELQEAVRGISEATDEANEALDRIQDVRSAITIVTSLVGLSTAIAAGNLPGILSAADTVLTAVGQAASNG